MPVPKKKKAVTEDDDRNLVLVDSDFSDADLDDRFWLIWERYKLVFLGGAAGLFVIGLGAIAWVSLRESKAQRLGAEYLAAKTPEDRMTFAESHRDEPVGALAALEAADAAYAKADYKEAAARYGRAAAFSASASAGDRTVLNRALIGAAVSEIRSGDTASGVKHLAEIAANPGRDAAVRSHANFLLAEEACGRRDFAAARGFLDAIDRQVGAEGWVSQDSHHPKQELINAYPELKAPVAVVPPAAPSTPAKS